LYIYMIYISNITRKLNRISSVDEANSINSETDYKIKISKRD